MPLYRVVAQRLFEQAEGLQALDGASGDEPCAPAAQAEVERQQPERRRARRCPMMARRAPSAVAQCAPAQVRGTVLIAAWFARYPTPRRRPAIACAEALEQPRSRAPPLVATDFCRSAG